MSRVATDIVSCQWGKERHKRSRVSTRVANSEYPSTVVCRIDVKVAARGHCWAKAAVL